MAKKKSTLKPDETLLVVAVKKTLKKDFKNKCSDNDDTIKNAINRFMENYVK